ncbi:MAG: hypothetical protein WB685_14775, partial [Pseudolabrys sp.]
MISDLVTRKCSPRFSTLEEDMGDVLGGVFSELDLGNKWAGQFFTPDPVCRMMAAMTFDSSAREIIETRSYPGARPNPASVPVPWLSRLPANCA